MKVYIENNNTCTRVKLYGMDVINLFKCNNCEIVKNKNNADYIVINTCSFLNSKAKYFLDKVKKLYEEKCENQKVIIIGCLGGSNKDDVLNISKDIIIFKRDINEIKEYFKFKNIPKTKSSSVSDKLSIKKEMLYLFNKFILRSKHIEYRLKRNKVCYLQISSGCMGKCSYCSEKYITKLKSRSIDDIIDAIYDGISRGYRLFGLNSDDASCYGKDIGSSLEDLLNRVVDIDEDIYFSIPEFNPQGLTDRVVELLKDKKFLYITCPIQSGSNKILKSMKRPYTIEYALKQLSRVKENNKNIMINTHVIVGFPGETEKEFNKTLEVLESGLFDRVKVFMYNERPNTEAVKLKNKVSDEEKLIRKEKVLDVVRKSNIKKKSLTNLILNKEQLK